MKLQIVSDLHIEYNNDKIVNPLNYIKPEGDILILAGDIGSLYKFDQLYSFIYEISKHFKFVIYVLGNHEYYTEQNFEPLEINELEKNIQKIEKKIENIRILKCSSVLINDICIAGATLWSDMKCDLPKYIVRIHKITKNIYLSKFENDKIYLDNIIKYSNKNKLKLIVVTHYPPTYDVLKEAGLTKKEKFKSLYYSDLDYFFEENKIDIWICGHTHGNVDFIKNGCRIVSNQKGKPKDNINNFQKNFLINI